MGWMFWFPPSGLRGSAHWNLKSFWILRFPQSHRITSKYCPSLCDDARLFIISSWACHLLLALPLAAWASTCRHAACGLPACSLPFEWGKHTSAISRYLAHSVEQLKFCWCHWWWLLHVPLVDNFKSTPSVSQRLGAGILWKSSFLNCYINE